MVRLLIKQIFSQLRGHVKLFYNNPANYLTFDLFYIFLYTKTNRGFHLTLQSKQIVIISGEK